MASTMQSAPKVFGSWFSADMRTLCNVLDISEKKYADESMSFNLLD